MHLKALQAALPDEPNVAEIIGLMDTFNGENPIKVTSVTTFFNTLNNNGLYIYLMFVLLLLIPLILYK